MAPASLLLDGSVLEGGGQLLRNAVALSALLSKPITVNNIRQSRNRPGLRPQHAAGLHLAAEICSAKLMGSEPGSSSIQFIPGPIKLSETYTADPGTAGSTALLLQVALPCLLFTPPDPHALYGPPPAQTELILRGGTNAAQAPQIDYAQHILLPFLQQHFGIAAMIQVRKRGYYPRGGGEVRVSIPPLFGPLPPVTLTKRGALTSITGSAYVAGLSWRLAEQMRRAAHARLVASGIDPRIVNIAAVRERDEDAVGSGSGVVLWAETEEGCRLGGSAVGMKGKMAMAVGEEAAAELLRNLQEGGCVDEHLQDQIVIFLALAAGRSTIRTGPLTLHTKTAIWVAEQLTNARFNVEEDEADRTVLLSCNGIGYTAALKSALAQTSRT